MHPGLPERASSEEFQGRVVGSVVAVHSGNAVSVPVDAWQAPVAVRIHAHRVRACLMPVVAKYEYNATPCVLSCMYVGTYL